MAQITIRIPDEERQMIEEYCADEDLKISQVVRKAIREYLERNL